MLKKDATAIILEMFEEYDVKHEILDDDLFRFTVSGHNLKHIPIIIVCRYDSIEVHCSNIVTVNKNYDKVLEFLNSLNSEHRWYKFCIDEDGELICSADSFVNNETKVVLYYLIFNMAKIIDEMYPKLIKIMW